MAPKFGFLVIVITILIAVAALGIALAPRIVQAQSNNQNMRALIQSLVDSGQPFTIGGLAANWDVDGSTVSVSDLGDDFVCVSGSSVMNYSAQPVQTACSSFGGIVIFVP